LFPNTSPESRIVQHLLIDADDTLWENNIYFERAFDDFADFLNHSSLTREEVRAIFNEFELATVSNKRYGSAAFTESLRACYHRLCEREIDQHDVQTVMSFGERILEQEIELLPGVEETLRELSPRHQLILYTKGNQNEQQLKIDRSGLAAYFDFTLVVPEKDIDGYRSAVAELGLIVEHAWMIGNSPKSDINPALAAGLGAVHIPHERTWMLEHQEINQGARFLTLPRFADLLLHF
jgi:putative hydrolase of the HAD superfamily